METAFEGTSQGTSSVPPQQAFYTPKSSASDEQSHAATGTSRKLASCNLCRRRKVRCDKANPCSSCLRAGVVCISTTLERVPRGRQGSRRKPDGELLKRIAKLENLVKNLEAENGGVPPVASPVSSGDSQPGFEVSDRGQASEIKLRGSESSTSLPRDHLDRYLSSSFWVTLSDEVSGLREVLNDSSDDEIEYEDSKHLPNQDVSVPIQASYSNLAILGSTPSGRPTTALQHPSLPQVHALCSTFLANVDVIFKVLHGPSLKRYLYGQAGDLACSPGPNGLEALRFAIYYAATTSLTAAQCMMRMGEERSALLTRYRASVEVALAKADFLNTVELSTLQALAIFLVALRSNDSTRLSWTLLALAVRIGQALGLHREESFASLGLFDKEMRRRLWWQLFILDGQGSHDRGSDPIMRKSSFNTRRPLDVNDEDLSPEKAEDPKERKDFTDMTFSAISREAAEAVVELNFVPAGEPRHVQNDIAGAWNKRRDFVISIQHRVQDKYLRYCDPAIPIHYAINKVAEIIMAELWLTLYRPLQKPFEDSTSFQPTHPNILYLSVVVMEKAYQLSTDPVTQPVWWLAGNYTQWHALAVALGELCVQTEGPIVDRAWAIIDAVFVRIEKTVADSNTGMLWAPIRKLARRARSAREHHLLLEAAQAFTGISDMREALPIPEQGRMSSMIDRGQDAMGGQPVAILQQYNASLSEPTLDWNAMFQGTESGFELDLADANEGAWANWEVFVEDLYGPGGLMQE